MAAEADRTGALIRDARSAVNRAHSFLLEPTPQNVAIAAAALSNAIRNVQELKTDVDGEMGEFARRLRESLRDIAALLDAAAMYHARLLESMAHAETARNGSKNPIQMGIGVQLHA